MARPNENQAEPRRGNEPGEEAYLALIGERLREIRTRHGMSRKALSESSGVSERYLAEMERGAGNASLLVVRRLAAAVGMTVADLAADEANCSPDIDQTIKRIEQLTPAEVVEVRDWLARRLSVTAVQPDARFSVVSTTVPVKSTASGG